MIVQQAQLGPDGTCKGIDTILRIWPELAQQLKVLGYSFVVRYIGTGPSALTPTERDIITDAGLGLMVVTFGGKNGWLPSKDNGHAKGLSDVVHAKAAGVMEGTSAFFDYEGPGICTAYTMADDINARTDVVADEGFRPGLYNGFGMPFSSDQLYKMLKLSCYWKSCSQVPDVAVRGYCMIQHYPPNQHVAGAQVDINTIKADNLGGVPYWMAA